MSLAEKSVETISHDQEFLNTFKTIENLTLVIGFDFALHKYRLLKKSKQFSSSFSQGLDAIVIPLNMLNMQDDFSEIYSPVVWFSISFEHTQLNPYFYVN